MGLEGKSDRLGGMQVNEHPGTTRMQLRPEWADGSRRGECYKMREGKEAGRAPARWCIMFLSTRRICDVILSSKGNY